MLFRHFYHRLTISPFIPAGRCQTVSEVVRAGLRKLEDDDRTLEALTGKLAAGERSAKIGDFLLLFIRNVGELNRLAAISDLL